LNDKLLGRAPVGQGKVFLYLQDSSNEWLTSQFAENGVLEHKWGSNLDIRMDRQLPNSLLARTHLETMSSLENVAPLDPPVIKRRSQLEHITIEGSSKYDDR